MTQHEDPRGNRLLAALANAEWKRWRPQLECVDLTRGQVLCEPGRRQRHAYFPTSAVVSLLCPLVGGTLTQVAATGNEGVVGTSLLLGSDRMATGSAVLIAGKGFRIGAQAIQREFDQFDAVRSVLLRYIQALMAQIAQTAICNRHHAVERQLCGFMLHSLDRLLGSEVVVTQELIAGVLGVRRESVTAAAGRLQEDGVIRYSRGHIAVLDRGELERRSCECHGVVKREYDRLLPPEPVPRPVDPGRLILPAWQEAALTRSTSQHALESSEPWRIGLTDRRRSGFRHPPPAFSDARVP